MRRDKRDDAAIINVTRTQRVYERIKADIVDKRLNWGQKIDIQDLTEKYGVSRSPIVKALDKLHYEGLIIVRPQAGSFVFQPTEQDILEVAELRVACERAAFEYAYEKHRSELVGRLEENERSYAERSAMEPHFSREFYDEYDVRFHLIPAELADNSRILAVLEQVQSLLQIFRFESFSEERLQVSHDSHQAILTSLKGGHLDSALALLRSHIYDAADYTTKIFRMRIAERETDI